MKITVIIPTLQKGGAERVAVRLMKAWAGAHDVQAILFDGVVEYPCDQKIININVPASPNPLRKMTNLFRRALKIRTLLKSERPDLVIAFMESASMPAILSGMDVIASIRADPRPLFHPFVRKIQGWMYRRPNVRKIICNSERMEELVTREYRVKRTGLIYNPIDADEIAAHQNEFEPEIPGPFIVAAGRFMDQKNFPMLIDAFGRSIASKKYYLVLLGDGPLRPAFLRRIQEHGIGDRVFMPGSVANPFPYFHKAFCFVSTSNFEGFPNVLLESLACGTPVVATNCDFGPSEMIQPGHNGYLIETGNVNQLVSKLDEICSDPESMIRMKPNCRPSLSPYATAKIAGQWLGL